MEEVSLQYTSYSLSRQRTFCESERSRGRVERREDPLHRVCRAGAELDEDGQAEKGRRHACVSLFLWLTRDAKLGEAGREQRRFSFSLLDFAPDHSTG